MLKTLDDFLYGKIKTAFVVDLYRITYMEKLMNWQKRNENKIEHREIRSQWAAIDSL